MEPRQIVAAKLSEAGINLSDDDLDRMTADLDELEREVSDLRRQVFDCIDALQAEITRRYRTGEANVESLLQ